jgi:hypothetical protein
MNIPSAINRESGLARDCPMEDRLEAELNTKPIILIFRSPG